MTAQENSDSSSATSGCSGVTDTPAQSRNVQGTPCALAELIGKIHANIADAQVLADELVSRGYLEKAGHWKAAIWAFLRVLQWIEDFTPPSDNTAGDTKSSSAGVP